MKVDLENITLGHSPISDSIFAGIPLKNGVWRHKKNVTNDFMACVISRWEGHSEIITDGKNQYEITVKKIANVQYASPIATVSVTEQAEPVIEIPHRKK